MSSASTGRRQAEHHDAPASAPDWTGDHHAHMPVVVVAKFRTGVSSL